MAWGITSPAVPQTKASRDCLKVAFSLPRGEEKGPILPRWVPRPRGLAAELASLCRRRPLKRSQGALSCRDDCAAVDALTARSRGPFPSRVGGVLAAVRMGRNFRAVGCGFADAPQMPPLGAGSARREARVCDRDPARVGGGTDAWSRREVTAAEPPRSETLEGRRRGPSVLSWQV